MTVLDEVLARLKVLENALAERDHQLAERDRQLVERDARITLLEVRVAELEEELRRNSSNSSRPPSSDSPAQRLARAAEAQGGQRQAQRQEARRTAWAQGPQADALPARASCRNRRVRA